MKNWNELSCRFVITYEAFSRETVAFRGKNFNQIIELLDNLDNYTEEELDQQLNILTEGKLDLLFWKDDPFPGNKKEVL